MPYTTYKDLVQSFSPAYYFKLDNTSWPVVNDGSTSATLNQGNGYANYTIDQTGIVSKCVLAPTSQTQSYFYTSESSSILNSAWTFSGWVKFTSGTVGGGQLLYLSNDQTGSNRRDFTIYANLVNNTVGVLGYTHNVGNSGNQGGEKTFSTTTDTWVHIAITMDAGTVTYYVNGSSIGTDTNKSYPSTDFNDLRKGWLGHPYSLTSSSRYMYADELSLFPSALSSTNISDLQLWPLSAYPVADPATASATAVHPAVSAIKNVNYSHTAMTASADIGDVKVSNFDIVPGLGQHLAGLTLEHLYKFTDLYGSYDNYNYGAQTFYDDWNLDDFGNYANTVNGPTFEPAIKFFDQNQLWFRDGDDKQLNIDASDYDWVIGFWIKSDFSDSFNLLHAINIDETDTDMVTISYDLTNDELYFTLDGNTSIVADPISANEWHFIAIRYDGEDFVAYIDGQNVGNQQVSPPELGISRIAIGSPASGGYTELSNFLLTASADLSDQDLEDIYNAGNQTIQGLALMPKNVLVKFNTQYNDKIESLNAIVDFRFNDEPIWTPNFGTNTGAQYFPLGEDIVTNITAKNIRAFKIENSASPYGAAFQGETQLETNQTVSFSLIAKLEAATSSVDDHYLIAGPIVDSTIDDYGNLELIRNTNGVKLKLSDNAFETVQSHSAEYTFDPDKYYHFVITFDNGLAKVYIDGKEEISANLGTEFVLVPDMNFSLGGFEFDENARTVARYIDEFAVIPAVLDAQEVFELWQSITIDGAFTASALFEVPVGTTGYGPTIHPGAMYVDALFVDPTQQDEIIQLPAPATAFATFMHPNYVAEVFIPVTYNASAMTVTAELHMPGASIGENNIVSHMEASAEMPNALFSTAGNIQVNPGIALNATLVMPGIVTIKGALVKAGVMTASAFAPVPPAYFDLTDDKYFNRLFAQHSIISEEAPFRTTNIPTDPATLPKQSFLKFFDDVDNEITITSSYNLESELPAYIFQRPGQYNLDNSGNPILDQTKTKIGPRGIDVRANRPKLTPGFFDNQQRPAVKLNNIEFAYPETSFIADRGYSLEFTVKTEKSNQIMFKGIWNSYYGVAQSVASIGLFGGKLYGMTSFVSSAVEGVEMHPSNYTRFANAQLEPGYMVSNKRIDDGQWHHVIIQYGFGDNRTQIWIDGELDRQLFRNGNTPGSNGTARIRPYIFGHNSSVDTLASNFEISVLSYDPAAFITASDTYANFLAYSNSEPIAVEPMLANIGITQNTKAQGNRTRALMLYFWPETSDITATGTLKPYNNGSTTGPETLAQFSTVDYYNQPPQQWLEWDIFPVDISGYFLSDVIKPEAFGGEENAKLVNLQGQTVTEAQKPNAGLLRKVNARDYFRDIKTDARRYIDVLNDIDLSNFDVIMFKNFPDESGELDSFTKGESVDSYFGSIEKNLYEAFLKSLRAAVDTGISLLVTNPQLAIDLGIINRLEILPSQQQTQNDSVQAYEYDLIKGTRFGQTTVVPPSKSDGFGYPDSHYMTYERVVNLIPEVTDFAIGIRTDKSKWQFNGLEDFTGTDFNWERVEWRQNGLQVGDIMEKFIMAGHNIYGVPFENIKAGKPFTAWQSTVVNGNVITDNRYKDYATTIIVNKGDILDGKQVGGRIFVDLMGDIVRSTDYSSIDLNTDFWINKAFEIGAITEDEKQEFLNSSKNLDNLYPNSSSADYLARAYWTRNEQAYLKLGGTQVELKKALGLDQVALAGKRASNRKKTYNDRVIDKAFGQYTGGGALWFAIQYVYDLPTFALWTPSTSSLGVLWVSERLEAPAQQTNHTAQTATANFVMPTVVADKSTTVVVQHMIASATIRDAANRQPADISNAALPFTAYAAMINLGKTILAEPMLVTALATAQNKSNTSDVDEVVVYIYHVDPILYIREDVIK